MPRFRVSSLHVFVAIILCGPFVGGREPEPPKPVWRTDLQQVGFFPAQGFQVYAGRHWMVSEIGADSVAFGRGDRIAVAFLNEEFGREGRPTAGLPPELHLVMLDSATGRIVDNRAWPVPRPDLQSTSVGATQEGNYLVLQGDGLHMYSPGFQELAKFDIPPDPANSGSRWSLLVPPDGRVVFLEHYLKGSYTLHMLSAATLHEVRSWDKTERIDAASARYLATSGKDRILYIRGLDTSWRPIADFSGCPGPRTRNAARFATENSLVMGGCGRLQLMTIDGMVLFTTGPAKGHLPAGAWGALGGRFLAVATNRMKGVTVQLLDMYRHAEPWRVLVYDTKTGDIVIAPKFTWPLGCAFAPDSSALALLSGGVVELYRLPQSNSK